MQDGVNVPDTDTVADFQIADARAHLPDTSPHVFVPHTGAYVIVALADAKFRVPDSCPQRARGCKPDSGAQ